MHQLKYILFTLNKTIDNNVHLEQYKRYKVFEINKGDEDDA